MAANEDYTNNDARIFDPVLRRYARATAWLLFEGAQPDLKPGATFDNVEFDTECREVGSFHGPECRIILVTVRRRSDGPNGSDVVSVLPAQLHAFHATAIRWAHDLAYRSMN